MENDLRFREDKLFIQGVRQMSRPDRKARLDKDHAKLSVRIQRQLLGLTRSCVYHTPRAANNNDDLEAMRRIDELYTKWPFMGSHRMVIMLRLEGMILNRPPTHEITDRPDLSISAEGFTDHPAKPGVVRGHHIYPDWPRLFIPRGNHGLVLTRRT